MTSRPWAPTLCKFPLSLQQLTRMQPWWWVPEQGIQVSQACSLLPSQQGYFKWHLNMISVAATGQSIYSPLCHCSPASSVHSLSSALQTVSSSACTDKDGTGKFILNISAISVLFRKRCVFHRLNLSGKWHVWSGRCSTVEAQRNLTVKKKCNPKSRHHQIKHLLGLAHHSQHTPTLAAN